MAPKTALSPVALFPDYQSLRYVSFADYPDLSQLLAAGSPWQTEHWHWGQNFLNYIGRNKSEHTYTRFRNETERFLLWLFMFANKPMGELKKADILAYVDFCWQPPENWICLANVEKFTDQNGYYLTNPKWAPFRLLVPKQVAKTEKTLNKSRYRPSQQTLSALFTGLIAFYKYLITEDILEANPAQMAKPDCRYFVNDAQVQEVRRLTEDQWQCLLETATKMADADALWERALFTLCALKVLFLRISELSERANWSPTMGDFWQDSQGNWWLKIFGKGRKLRDVSVPEAFLPYLKRYRQWRGLTPLPSVGEREVLVEKIRGQGGMTSRQLTRIIQSLFDEAYDAMKHKQGPDAAQKLKEATTHWLRHTGASMEVERGRPLKDLSEDLGHASMATTDTIYVQTESQRRAASGKSRKV